MDDWTKIEASTPLFKKLTQEMEENVKAWLRALIHIKNGFIHIFLNNPSLERNPIKSDIHL